MSVDAEDRPLDYNLLRRAAVIHLKANSPEQALALLRTALDRVPKPIPERTAADLYMLTAEAHLALEQHEQAKRLANRAFGLVGRVGKGSAGVGCAHTHNQANLAACRGKKAIAIDVSSKGVLALVNDHSIELWDLRHDSLLDTLEITGAPNDLDAIAFSPSGNAIVIGSADGKLSLWEVDNEGKLRETTWDGHEMRHEGAVRSVDLSWDGRWIGSGGEDGAVRIWDAETDALEDKHHEHRDQVSTLAFAPDSSVLASGGADNVIIVWHTGDDRIERLRSHSASVHELCFSRDGNTLISAGGDRVLRLWDTEYYQQKSALEGHGHAVLSLDWSRDETLLVSAGQDSEIRFWRAPLSGE